MHPELTIATGISEHDNYAKDFIESVRWIKENLPYAKTSGGISNVSFSFRGITPEYDTGELDEAEKRVKDFGKYQPLAKDFLSDFEEAGLLTDGVTIEVKANTSEIPTAMSELTAAVE